MVFGQGTGRDSGGPIIFLAYAYGSPNWTLFGLSGIACFTPRLAACTMVMGDMTFPDAAQFFPLRYDDPDWKCPELIVSWARNLQGSQCADHYFSGHFVIDMMKRGAKLLVIDPYNGWEASRAELWLQLRPGTDGALALGMLNVIIEENLYDKEFVEKWTHGFDELKAEVAKQYPRRGLPRSPGCPTDKIVKAARMYATAKPAADALRPTAGFERRSRRQHPRLGVPLGAHRQHRQSRRQRHLPPALRRHHLSVLHGGGHPALRPGVRRQDEREAHRRRPVPAGEELPLVGACPTSFSSRWRPASPTRSRDSGARPTTSWPNTAQDPRRHYEAVRKLDFNVVVDTFMTPTAQAIADIVLPAGAFTEKDSVFTTGVPLNADPEGRRRPTNASPTGRSTSSWPSA